MKYAENGRFLRHEAMKQIEEEGYVAALIQEGMQTVHKFGIAIISRLVR